MIINYSKIVFYATSNRENDPEKINDLQYQIPSQERR